MLTDGNILIVDDDNDVLLAARLLLKQHFSSVTCCDDPREIEQLMGNLDFDVILLDMNFTIDATSGNEGFHWLSKILCLDPLAIVIFITAYGDIETAVKAIHNGATDFILKPWENERLIATTLTAFNLRRSKTEVQRLQRRHEQLSTALNTQFHEMIGSCSAMQKIFKYLEKVAKTDASVLILGENGTGKELVARALHRSSARSREVFITVDMGAIADNLFESELFGHEKGAFTDAVDVRLGRFEIASGGSLFLDEISNLSSTMQAKLLRVIEERQVTRVGSNKPIPFDIRLICATNGHLDKMVDENTFRQDLLYRINTVEIHLPPLRDRGKDIELLAQHFIKRFGKKYKKEPLTLSAEALSKLNEYNWPGNVRELKHTIERAIIMSESEQLIAEDFHFRKRNHLETRTSNNLEAIEKTIISEVLQKNNGNISRSAEELGLTRAALYRRINKHDL